MRGILSRISIILFIFKVINTQLTTNFNESSTGTFTDLDKVTNLTFDENSSSITFTRPQSFYDEIFLSCLAEDQICSSNDVYLSNTTGNCSTCTSIILSSITKGVSYQCYAITIKEGFPNVSSDQFIFNTSLQSVIVDRSSESIFNVTIASDFHNIESNCSIESNETYPCLNLLINHEQCSTILIHNGTHGCSYQCYFLTKKKNYLEKYSINYPMNLLPLKPKLFVSGKGSRFISIDWTFDEPVYVQYYRIYLNRILINILNGDMSSYDYINLLPNQEYQLYIQIISNDNSSVTTEPILVKTSEEAPAIPSDDDVKNKIIPLTNDIQSTGEEYAIEIDLSLFSNQYGRILFHRIYVRQNMNKTTLKLDVVGTYSAAMKNQTLDYLSQIIPLSSSSRKLKILLGNESICSDDFNASIPCNGKLKVEKNYKIVVSACSNPGCSSVLSKSFRTMKFSPMESKSISWIAIFPVLFILILSVVTIWRRKSLKDFYFQKLRQTKKMEQTSIEYQRKNSTIFLSATVCRMRPKFLIEFINMNKANEKSIYAEFQELQNFNPQNQTHESSYDNFNRYSNISARGPWNRTAVILTGEHRRYDYINANEIQSFDKKKDYIACQGPLKETCEDFWDMIVQYHSPTIIMLTKTDEFNPNHSQMIKSKCYQYFPNDFNEILIFGRLNIQLVQIEFNHQCDLQIRHINILQNNEIVHHVVHYYYTNWPDYNVVQPSKLIELIQTINNHRLFYEQRTKLRTVIHCSAGVGRTGTYIAVETIMRLIDCSDERLSNMKLDIMAIVYQLRRDRGKMVQTREQYMLINRCVEQYLKDTGRLDLIFQRTSSSTNSVNMSMNSNRKSSNRPHENRRSNT